MRRRRALLIQAVEEGKEFKARRHPIKSVRMEGNCEIVLEEDQKKAVQEVNRHAQIPCPFLTLPREIPEKHEDSGDNSIDDQVEYVTGGAGLVSEFIDNLRQSETEYESHTSAPHCQYRVHHRQPRDHEEPACASLRACKTRDFCSTATDSLVAAAGWLDQGR